MSCKGNVKSPQDNLLNLTETRFHLYSLEPHQLENQKRSTNAKRYSKYLLYLEGMKAQFLIFSDYSLNPKNQDMRGSSS